MNKNNEKHIIKGRTEIRRFKQAVRDEKWIKKFLGEAPIATIASVHEGQAFLTPMTFVYIEKENALYFHGAKTGRLRANIELNPKVSVNVFEMGALVPDEKAEDFGLDYKSVTIFGEAKLLEDDQESIFALKELMDKFFHQFETGKDYEPIQEADLKRTGVFKIAIEEWSGKELFTDSENKFDYSPKADS